MIKDNVLKKPDGGIFAMEMTIWDNPKISSEAIEGVKAECTDDLDVQVRLYGKRVLRGG